MGARHAAAVAVLPELAPQHPAEIPMSGLSALVDWPGQGTRGDYRRVDRCALIEPKPSIVNVARGFGRFPALTLPCTAASETELQIRKGLWPRNQRRPPLTHRSPRPRRAPA